MKKDRMEVLPVPRLLKIPDMIPPEMVPFLMVLGDGSKCGICIMPHLQAALQSLPLKSERDRDIEKLVAGIRSWLLDWSGKLETEKRQCN